MTQFLLPSLLGAAAVGLLAISEPVRAAPTATLPSCPGINPAISRPPGSNCLGILPHQCAADRAKKFLGRRYDQSLHAEIQRAVGDVAIRAYGERDPVTDDLRPNRLNVIYGSARRSTKVDCY